MKLGKLQAASGAAFALFLGLHLLTASSASAGADAYDRMLARLRAVYRPALPVELALVGVPAVVHIGCALVALVRRRRLAGAAASFRVRVHRYSGYVLLAAIFGHVYATRIMPALAIGPAATGKADFSYLAYSILNWPLFIIPYYLIFGAAGAVHLCLGLALAVKILAPARARTRTALRVGAVAAALVAAAVLAGVGSLILHAPTASPARFPEFHAAYERYLPLLRPHIGPTDHTAD
jgi:succinate dehydrogenase/fumarate reductase cytochrome b subunit